MSNKILHAVMLISFLFTGMTPDMAFGLATPSGLNEIAGIQHKDMAKVKIALASQLALIFPDGRDTGLTEGFHGKNPLIKEQTIFQPTDMQFFFREATAVAGVGICVKVRLNDERYGLRTYYAVFSMLQDEHGGFPTTVYTEEEYSRTAGFAKGMPERKAEDAAAIERYIQHEKGIDAVIRYAHEKGLAKEPLKESFDYRKEVLRLLQGRKITVRNPHSLTPIEDRQFFLIPLTAEIGDMIAKLPKARVVDASGKEHEVAYEAHSSNNAVHVFVAERDYQLLVNNLEWNDLDGGYRNHDRGGFTRTGRLPYVNLLEMVGHEIGVICNSKVTRVYKHLGKDVVENELDKIFRPWSETAGRDVPLEIAIANLDANLAIRDYAASDEVRRWVAADIAHSNWAEEKDAIDYIAGYIMREGGTEALVMIVDELAGNWDERLKAVIALLQKRLEKGNAEVVDKKLTKEFVASMVERARQQAATDVTAEQIDAKFTRPAFVPADAKLVKIYGEVDSYVVCRYEDAGREKSHYIAVFDKRNGRVPKWYAESKGYPLKHEGETVVRLDKGRHLITLYNQVRSSWDDNGGISEHYDILDTLNGEGYEFGAATSYAGPESFLMASGDGYVVLMTRSAHYKVHHVDKGGEGHEAYAGFMVLDLKHGRKAHKLSSYDYSRDHLNRVEGIRIVGGHYLLMEARSEYTDYDVIELYDIRQMLKGDTLPKPLYSSLCSDYRHDPDANRIYVTAHDRWGSVSSVEIDLNTGSVVTAEEKEIAAMAGLASKAGLQIPTHPTTRYNLLVTTEFVTKEEMIKHRIEYGDRFDLERISGKTHGQFIDNVLAKAAGKEAKTIALVPDDLPADELKKLTKAGVRFMRVNGADLREARKAELASREKFQADTYAIMLLLRRVDDSITVDSPLYKLLSFYLKSHFTLADKIAVDDYIKAIVNDDVARLIKGCLAYMPAEPYETPSYNSVAATLIAA